MKVCNDEEADWTIYWTDTILPEKLSEMKIYQKVNHFPGMNEICRKDLLCRNMNRMYKLFPKDYNCFPRTWTLPADFGDFQSYIQSNSKKNRVYISKPGSGCQGKGIFLLKGLKDIKPTEHQVCQQYITKPLLIDGFKFDLRIYILMTSCDPMRVYVFHDGLTRLATVKYKEPNGSNMDEFCMHLTNYAINKHSKDFIRDEEGGSKRRITTINRWFHDNGYNLEKIWDDIDDVIIKTLIAAHPVVKHNYRSSFPNHVRGSACFEILGFDILLDRKLKPWLIEVNRSPSFHTDAPLDKEIKEALLMDTLNLIDLYANDRKRCVEEEKKRVRERLLYKQKSKESDVNQDDVRAQYEANFEAFERQHLGGFRRIYPKNGNEEKYKKFFDQDTQLCAGTISSRARADLAKQFREELEAKQREMDKLLKKNISKGADSNPGESPPQNRKVLKKRSSSLPATVVNRRSISFRLSVPHSSDHKKDCEEDTSYGEPYESPTTPQNINEEEELQRLADLQVRESMIKGMGMTDQLRTILESQPSSRIHTPHLQHRVKADPMMGGVSKGWGGEESDMITYTTTTIPRLEYHDITSGSQPSLHVNSINSYNFGSSYTTYSSPSHSMGGPTSHHMASYRLQRQKGYPSIPSGARLRYAWDHNGTGGPSVDQYGRGQVAAPPYGYSPHSPHYQSQGPPTLQLYGFSIPTLPHKVTSTRQNGKQYFEKHRNYTRIDEHRLGIQGQSLTNRVKQLKYLSSLPQKTS